MPKEMMIDYLTVIYNKYELLSIQREQFDKLEYTNYRLIIVDNTPSSNYHPIVPRANELVIRRDNDGGEFDGISHGNALDLGIKYCTTDIVCVFDSDFFFTRNIQKYIDKKFEEGYSAVGTEFWNENYLPHYSTMPNMYQNIPCCFGSYYKLEMIKDISWVITPEEVNHSTGYIEVGYRIRKHIIDNNVKVFGWKCHSIHNNDNDFVYYDENNNIVGYHIVGGSHRNSGQSKDHIKTVIDGL